MMIRLAFRDFLLQCEQNVPGHHLDGNSGNFGNPIGGGYLDSQQTGSETKGTSHNIDNAGLSLYSTELGMPTFVDRNKTVIQVDHKNRMLMFQRGAPLRFQNEDMWRASVNGKIEPGDVVDVEYMMNRFDRNPFGLGQRILAIRKH